jgi:hypothetical protein
MTHVPFRIFRHRYKDGACSSLFVVFILAYNYHISILHLLFLCHQVVTRIANSSHPNQNVVPKLRQMSLTLPRHGQCQSELLSKMSSPGDRNSHLLQTLWSQQTPGVQYLRCPLWKYAQQSRYKPLVAGDTEPPANTNLNS